MESPQAAAGPQKTILDLVTEFEIKTAQMQLGLSVLNYHVSFK